MKNKNKSKGKASNSDVPLPSPSTPLSQEDSLKGRFLVSPSDDYTTAIEAFHAITKDQPSLNVNPKPLQSGDLVVQPLDTTSPNPAKYCRSWEW